MGPMHLPPELCHHLLAWIAAPSRLGAVSRQWRALLGQAWYREQATRRRWRQLRGSLEQLPRYQALAEVLRWGPPQLQEAVDHFAGALDSPYTRWVLFTYWTMDLWGEARLPRSVQRILDDFTPGDTKLALAAHMGPTENVVAWWMFTRFWQSHAAVFAANSLPLLASACRQALTPEQHAFARCAERSLFADP
jgi:hypothetical protein